MFDYKPPKFKSPSLRKYSLKKRDIAKATNVFNKSIRERVSADKRRKVLATAKNKCQYPKCSIKEKGDIKLEVHHKNMINQDNNLSNLMALCSTHHRVIHRKYKIVHKKDLMGRRISSRVFTKEKAKEIKQKRKQNPYGLNLKMNNLLYK